MELGKVDETYEDLRDLILREQFLTVSNRSLVLFLKERKITSIDEMVELAEQYHEAHSVNDNSNRTNYSNKSDNRTEVREEGIRGQVVEGTRQPRVFKERVCYSCGKSDHFIRECPHKNSLKQSSNFKAASLETDESQKKEIDETESEVGKAEAGITIEKSAATCIVLTPTSNPCSFVNSSLDVRTNVQTVHEVDLVNIACHGSGEHMGSRKETMPVREGLIGESKVLVLRDSDCNSVLVKRELVQEGEYTGIEVSCILADGTKRMFPVARINVHTSFYEGQVEALSMENPVYDLVIGNVEGARAVDDPNLNWKDEVSSMQECIKDGMAQCEVSAVETRAQNKREK